MSSRSRANSEVDGRQHGFWIEQVFSPYPLPTECNDPTRCIQSRRLGFASVKFGSYFYPNITFYEIMKKLAPNSSSSFFQLQKTIVFCMNQNLEQQVSGTSRYYQFPHEAIVEALHPPTPTLDVLVSFHLPKDSNISVLHSACSCTTEKQKNALSFSSKLEEFANVCTRPKRRLTDPGLQTSPFIHPKSDCYVINIGLSDVSEGLFGALKHVVLDFETRYEKMVQLMKLHNEQVAAQKMVGPLDVLEKNDWVSSEEEEEEESEEESTIGITLQMEGISSTPPVSSNKMNKQCSYCGSKSTPMWRRGPEGAGTLCNACGVKWKHGKILCGGTEYFPPPIYKKRTTEKKKRKYKKRMIKQEPIKNSKRAAATAAAAAIVAGNKYGTDLDVLLNSDEENEHHHRRRHTTDISMIQTYGFNSSFDAGVDAVEAAAVLTLLKRS